MLLGNFKLIAGSVGNFAKVSFAKVSFFMWRLFFYLIVHGSLKAVGIGGGSPAGKTDPFLYFSLSKIKWPDAFVPTTFDRLLPLFPLPRRQTAQVHFSLLALNKTTVDCLHSVRIR